MRLAVVLYLLIGFVFFNTKLLAFKDDSLKVKNNLSENAISIGQKLIVK